MAKLGRVRDLRFQNFSPRKKIVFFLYYNIPLIVFFFQNPFVDDPQGISRKKFGR